MLQPRAARIRRCKGGSSRHKSTPAACAGSPVAVSAPALRNDPGTALPACAERQAEGPAAYLGGAHWGPAGAHYSARRAKKRTCNATGRSSRGERALAEFGGLFMPCGGPLGSDPRGRVPGRPRRRQLGEGRDPAADCHLARVVDHRSHPGDGQRRRRLRGRRFSSESGASDTPSVGEALCEEGLHHRTRKPHSPESRGNT